MEKLDVVKEISGIYLIRNKVNNKIYIGSAVNIEKRLYAHLWALQKGRHDNIHLQRSWDKHESSVFIFKEYFTCKKKDLIFYEQLTIDAFIVRFGRENIFNINLIAGSSLGRKCSKETRLKIGFKSKGRWTGKHHTEETKLKIKISNLGKNSGKIASEATRKKMSKSRIGRKFTKEHKINLSKSIKKYWDNKKSHG